MSPWSDGAGLEQQLLNLRSQAQTVVDRLETARDDRQTDPAPVRALRSRLLQLARERLRHVEALSTTTAVADNWKTLADHRTALRALAADNLALEHTVRLREEPATELVCSAADALLDELSAAVGRSRAQYVLISEAEHVAEHVAAVHLGFSRLDFWSLLRAAHEFAHVWAEEVTSFQNRFWQVLRDADRGRTESHSKEFFADLVATYMMGPAYALHFVLLEFDPTDRRVSDTHPVSDDRALSVLSALEAMVTIALQPPPAVEIRAIADELKAYRTAVRERTGSRGERAGTMALQYSAETAIRQLRASIPEAMYGTFDRALRIKLEWNNVGAVPNDSTPRDVLNAAWLRRRERPRAADTIAENALAMFRHL